jgi:hypothetical protein
MAAGLPVSIAAARRCDAEDQQPLEWMAVRGAGAALEIELAFVPSRSGPMGKELTDRAAVSRGDAEGLRAAGLPRSWC